MIYNTNRETTVKNRLYPSRFHGRYYAVVKLRKGLEYVIEKYIDRTGQNKGVLVDLGCGIKPYQSVLAPYVSKHIGVDLPGNDLADVFINDAGQAIMDGEVADFVLSNQVLEHVVSPDVYLNECHRLLKPGGLLILSTHGYWMFHPDPTDFWRWTSAGLSKIVSDRGFEIQEVHGLMGLSATAIHLFQDSLNKRIPTFLKPVFFLIMQFLVQVFDRNNTQKEKNKDSCFYYVVAKRI